MEPSKVIVPPGVTNPVLLSAVAVPTGGPAPEQAMNYQRKEGGKCCGCCCDYRRAVIIMAIISIILGLISIISRLASDPGSNLDNDDLANDIDDVVHDYKAEFLTLMLLGLAVSIVCLVGAVTFNWKLVALHIVATVLLFILNIVFSVMQTKDMLDKFDEHDNLTESDDDVEDFIRLFAILSYVLSGICTALWLYPSVFLVAEIRRGIMTRETYPREEFSCCCASSHF